MTRGTAIKAIIACLGILTLLFAFAGCGITEGFNPDMTPDERNAEIQATANRIDAVLKLVDVDLRSIAINPADWPAVKAKILKHRIRIEGYRAAMEILIGAKNVPFAFTERYNQIIEAIEGSIIFYDNAAASLEQEARQRAPRLNSHTDTPEHWMLEHPLAHVWQEISF